MYTICFIYILVTGHAAEYITYCDMDLRSNKVAAVVVLNKHQTGGSSPRLEVEACRISLEFLQQSGIKIRHWLPEILNAKFKFSIQILCF